jgi:hypothetical protein
LAQLRVVEEQQEVATQARQEAAACTAAALAAPTAAAAAEARTEAAAAGAAAAAATAIAMDRAQRAASSATKQLAVPAAVVATAKRQLVGLEGAELAAGLAATLKETQAVLAAQGPDTPAQQREVERVLAVVRSEVYTAKGRKDEGTALHCEEQSTLRPIGRRNAEFFRHAMTTARGTAFELCGYVDGICEDHVVEVKNRMNRLFRSIPVYEKVQMHAYMLLSGKKLCSWVQRYCREQESRLVAWDTAWWEAEVLPSLHSTVERFHALMADETQQAALLASVDGLWAPPSK